MIAVVLAAFGAGDVDGLAQILLVVAVAGDGLGQVLLAVAVAVADG